MGKRTISKSKLVLFILASLLLLFVIFIVSRFIIEFWHLSIYGMKYMNNYEYYNVYALCFSLLSYIVVIFIKRKLVFNLFIINRKNGSPPNAHQKEK